MQRERTRPGSSPNLAWLALAAAVAACDGAKAAADDVAATPERAASSLALPVVGAPVRQGDLVLTITTTGQVRSAAVAELKAEATGTVQHVLVRPGQRVRRGESLVQLDPRPFDLAVSEAEAAVEQAQVSYNDRIVPDSIVSGQPPSDARRRAALAGSGLQAARVRLDRAQYEREQAVIRAPFTGVVDRIEVAAGERLSAGADIATVVDTDNLLIEAAVLEHDLPLVRAGGDALVTPSAAPGQPLTGRITAVLPLVDTTSRAGRALVQVRSNGVLRPGMYADVRLEAERLADRVVVPAPAIIERDGRPLVFVVEDGRAKWVYLTPGRSNGVETEVRPDSSTGKLPVAPGDTVLVEGHLTLTHDAPVRVD
jgi:RND family efflux transporter MFP subunit